MISLDTETTGVDLYHGAKPFVVTTCDEAGDVTFWEWDVNPETREPIIPAEDLNDIRQLIASQDKIVLQNPKFDAAALAAIGINDWPWDKTLDTLLAGHLLASNQPHDLTTMALVHLNVNIKPFEESLRDAVIEARRIARSQFPNWKTARKGLPDMPSASGETWRADYWLPRAIASALDYESEHPWWTVLSEYANSDSAVTLPLWKDQEEKIRQRGLWEIYEIRLKVLPIAFKMENRGVTINNDRINALLAEYRESSDIYGTKCVGFARSDGFDLKLPKSGNNKSLTEYLCGVQVFECPHCKLRYREPLEDPAQYCKKCKVGAKGKKYRIEDEEDGRLVFVEKNLGLNMLPVARGDVGFDHGSGNSASVQKNNPLLTDTGALSFDKDAIAHYLKLFKETEPRGKRYHFMKAIKKKRRYDTAVSYLESYLRFGKPWIPAFPGAVDPITEAGWYVLHPSLNPTGTNTLRWSSSNPNEQNISKQEAQCESCEGEGCGECGGTGIELKSLRYCFGPAPGREWWSCDAQNIELRLPAYESGELDLISLFERPNEPPYYGSTHLLNFHTVYPDIWDAELKLVGFEKVGPHCKKKYNYTWYQWCKNGGFAVQYGAVDREDGKGTADRAFHRPGAHRLLKQRFSKLEKLNQKYIAQANKLGYVETMPDKTVSNRGYPLSCTRSTWGKIVETVPLNYHVQGTAMWWMMKAMIRCQEYLDQLNRACKRPNHYAIALQVHDELVFDFPKGIGPEPWKTNLSKIKRIGELMAMGGDDIGVPTPVSREYHSDNWSEGVSV